MSIKGTGNSPRKSVAIHVPVGHDESNCWSIELKQVKGHFRHTHSKWTQRLLSNYLYERGLRSCISEDIVQSTELSAEKCSFSLHCFSTIDLDPWQGKACQIRTLIAYIQMHMQIRVRKSTETKCQLYATLIQVKPRQMQQVRAIVSVWLWVTSTWPSHSLHKALTTT